MRAALIVTLTVWLFNWSQVKSQCNSEESECIPQLANGFNYITSYKIDAANKRIEYSYVFCKGTEYLIDICSPDKGTNRIIVNVYDSQRNKVATSKIDDKCISKLAYQCNSSGIYYMQYTFNGNSTTYCGGSALAFKRN